MRKMEKAWNRYMTEDFNIQWIDVIDKIMMQWFEKYAPRFMCVWRKPHPFGT